LFFYLQLSSEKDHIKILKCIQEHMKPDQRIFVGVADLVNPKIETPEIVRDRV
jgi:5-methyltetrahydropteroyltriglutamate--homocysteine methyltransferase